MDVLLTVIHILAALILIGVVLLQQGKGADVGAAFGGGSSQTVFGSRGAGNFLTKMTTLFVILFMVSSVGLAIRSTPDAIFTDLDELPPDEPPAAEAFPEATPIDDSAEDGGLMPEGFESVPSPTGSDAAPGAAAPTPSQPEPAAADSAESGASGSGSAESGEAQPSAGSDAESGQTTP